MALYQVKFKENVGFVEKVNHVSKIGNFFMLQDFFYINTDLEEKQVDFNNDIEELVEINKQTINKIHSEQAKTWCRSFILKEELSIFEKSESCQNKLKEITKYLDDIEKGGEGSGKRKRGRPRKKAEDAIDTDTRDVDNK